MKAVGSKEYEAFRAFKKINNAFKAKLPLLISDYNKQPKENGERIKKVARVGEKG